MFHLQGSLKLFLFLESRYEAYEDICIVVVSQFWFFFVKTAVCVLH
jgi:hypothetical protein